MRFLLFTIVLIAGCSTSVIQKAETNIFGLENVLTIVPGESSKKVILNAFSEPSEKKVRSKEEIWIYRDSRSPYQRLILKFDSKENLDTLVWIPGVDERENNIFEIKSKIKGAQFSPNETIEDGKDYWRRLINWTDKSTGITLVQYEGNNEVEYVTRTNLQTGNFATFTGVVPARRESSSKD